MTNTTNAKTAKHSTATSSNALRNSSMLYTRHGRTVAGIAVSLAGLTAAQNAYAVDGANVVSGDVSFSHDVSAANVAAPKDLTITQRTQNALIDWNSFNIAGDESVTFKQNNSSSTAVNRVLNGKPTEIAGKLTANGRVVIVNGDGVFFTKTSRVDAAALIVSTANVSNENFDKFNRGELSTLALNQAGKADARILNEGNITAKDGGLVAFVGANVQNDGVIVANEGTIQLAGAETATVDLNGDGLVSLAVSDNVLTSAINTGQMVAAGGNIVMTAEAAKNVVDSIVNNSGVIDASSAHSEGGTIVLTGGDITLAAGSKIDASGATGGGKVLVGGDYQGGGDLAHAKTVTMEKGAKIDVSAKDNGNGGTAVLWSDAKTIFEGDIEAKGGANGGDGGLVETSSKNILMALGSVNASAAQGTGGEWLLDPNDITIVNAGADTNIDGNYTSTNDNAIVTNATIQASLNSGTSVTITTGSGGTNAQAGDITVAAGVDINKTAGGNASLKLQADRDIVIGVGSDIRSTAGKLDVTLNSRRNGGATGSVTLTQNNKIITNGGNIKIGGGANADDFAIGSVNHQFGVDLNNSDLTAGGGNITIKGRGQGIADVGSGFRTVGIRGQAADITTTGAGTITMVGETVASALTNSAHGIYLNAGTITAADGDISLTGTSSGSTGQENHGIFNRAVITSTGAGDIAMTGTGGSGTLQNTGIINGTNKISALGGGTITLTGTAGASSSGASIGIQDFRVEAAGGDVIISGTGTNGGDGIRSIVGGFKLTNGSDLTINGNGIDLAGSTVGFPMGDAVTTGNVTLNSTTDITLAASADMTTAGKVTFNSANGIKVYGDIVGNGGIALTTTAGQVLVSGDITTASAGDIDITGPSYLQTGQVGGASMTGDITVVTDFVSAGATPNNAATVPLTQTTGKIWYKPLTAGTNIKVGTAALAGGTPTAGLGLQFTDAMIDKLEGGLIVIGDRVKSTGSYVINLATTLDDKTHFIQADTITGAMVIDRQINSSASGDGALVVVAGGNFDNNAGATPLNSTAGHSELYVNKKLINGTFAVNDFGGFTYGGAGKHFVKVENTSFGDDNNVGGDAPTESVDTLHWMRSVALIIDANDKGPLTYGDAVNHNGATGFTLTSGALKAGDTLASVSLTDDAEFSSSGKKKAGTWTITASNAQTAGGTALVNEGYDIDYTKGDLIIDKKTLPQAGLTVTAKNKVYNGNNTAEVESITSSDIIGIDKVTFTNTGATFSDKNAADGKTVTVTGIAAGGDDAGNYVLASTTKTTTANITKRDVTVNYVSDFNDKPYDGTTTATLKTGAVPDISNIVTGDDLTASFTAANFANKNASPNNKVVNVTGITLAGTEVANYNLVNLTDVDVAKINAKGITVTANDITRAYGDVNPALTYTATGLIGTDTLSGAIKTTAVQASDVGVYEITQDTLANSNYNITFVNGELTVNPADLVIKANDVIGVYGTADFNGFTATGLKLTDTVGSATLIASSGLSSSGHINATVTPGTVTASNATGGTFKASNYNIAYQAGVLDVSKKSITITSGLDGVDREYNGTKVAGLVLTGPQTFGGKVGIDELNIDLTGATGEFADRHVGVDKSITVVGAKLTGADAANYSLDDQPNVNATVTARDLTINTDQKTRAYGDDNPALTYTSTGLIQNVGDSITGALATLADKFSGVGTYAITQGNVTAGNDYNIIFNGNTLTINPATLILTANDVIGEYGTADFNGFEADGLKNGETILADLTASTGLSTSKHINAGTGTIDISNAHGGTANLTNYAITLVNGVLDIARKNLEATVTVNPKDYDGTTTMTINNIALVLPIVDDIVGATGIANSTSPNAGTHLVNVTDITLNGADAANYTVNGAATNGTATGTTTGTINKRAATITIGDLNSIYGDGTKATDAVTTSNNIVAGELFDLTVDSNATLAPGSGQENAGTWDLTGSNPVAASGSAFNIDNYDLTITNGEWIVGRAKLNVTALPVDITQGNALPPLPYDYNGFVLGDGPNSGSFPLTPNSLFAGALGSDYVVGDPAGSYNILPGTLNAGLNYDIVFTNAGINVTNNLVTVNAPASVNPNNLLNIDPVIFEQFSYAGQLLRVEGQPQAPQFGAPATANLSMLGSPAGGLGGLAPAAGGNLGDLSPSAGGSNARGQGGETTGAGGCLNDFLSNPLAADCENTTGQQSNI